MYSRKAWGGSVDPFILVKFHKANNVKGDPKASLIIFEWKDEQLIGEYRNPKDEVCVQDPAPRIETVGTNRRIQTKETICDQANVDAKLCTKDQIGSFLLTKNASDVSQNPIISKAVHLTHPDAVKYPVRKTGFYCVSTYAFDGEDYNAVVTFRNSYGELPAAQIAKLPFYGALTIVYAVIGVYVLIRFGQLRKYSCWITVSGLFFMRRIDSTSVRQLLSFSLRSANNQQCPFKTTSPQSSCS